ncbi:MAG: formate dehydrogenase subunit gamma [Pseudoxanthomonas suwonensis]|nr:formate dehydrogenase subunit gamma [Pseudoxanthomonas suwonensis]
MRERRPTESIVEVIPLLDPVHASSVEAAIRAHHDEPGALLPILHAVQDALGHVPPGAVAPIARALALTRADVHGVISFYPDFRNAPAARHVVKLCQAEACQAMGALEVLAHARQQLGVAEGATDSADGRWTLEPAYCLGNCALSPAMLVGERLHGRVDTSRFDAIVAALDNEARPA